MRYRNFTAALTAAALLYTPVPSFAQSAPEPAWSDESGLELRHEGEPHRRRRGATMWVVLGFVTLVILYVLLHDKNEQPEPPASP